MFIPKISDTVVQVLTDNITAMVYINKLGGGTWSSALCQDILPLWDLCVQHDICLEAAYLLGERNVLVDHLSRAFSYHMWFLHPEVIRVIFQRWGFLPGGPIHHQAEQ